MYPEPQWVITDSRKRPFLRADLGALATIACLTIIVIISLVAFPPSLAKTGANSPYRVTSCIKGDVLAVQWGDDIWFVYEVLDNTQTTVGYYGTRNEALAAAIRWCNG